ncbi:helix-turn-helix domain-containing protein [Lentzea sp. NPDC051213]|uniref:helix-turn-helix domain-containing protein n=1 Tax=Lentzea sp. NPDC051213 TaxID=3364126 RepID=UPI0037A87B7A
MRKRHPPFRRRKLAKKLRKLRLHARMSIQEAAKALDKDVQALYRIEAAETRVDVHLVRSMMDLYDAYDPDLLDQVRDALKAGWWRAFGIKGHGYLDVETEAAIVRELALLTIPGLLQTEAYMHAIFEAHHPRHSAEALRNNVAVRLIRQRRLTDPDHPLALEAIIDEAALRKMVGGPDVMRAQLRHLLEMMALPNVMLRILSADLGVYDAMSSGSFTLVGFPDPDDLDVLYVPYVTGALHIENQEEPKAARLTFDRLAAKALTPDQSTALIERILAE